MVNHPWQVQAPPWRSGPRPVLQKYAGTDFIDRFRAAPDRPARWSAARDVVQNVLRAGDAFVEEDGVEKQVELSGKRFQPTTVRKLFQPAHQRFYLVVCELVCDTQGRPPVGRAQVSEAFFVIRRRRSVLDADTADAVVGATTAHARAGARAKLVEGIATEIKAKTTAEILRLESERARITTALGKFLPPSVSGSVPWKTLKPLHARRNRLHARLETLTAKQEALAAEIGTIELVEGWIPDAHAEFGRWRPVANAPEVLEEAKFPLYPLIPGPDASDNPANGRSVWYGLVPTATRETTRQGAPQFDSLRTYEIACAFRRRRPECPRDDRGGDLVWSDPSDGYRLAAPFDPHGVAQRPVTVEMPDFDQLEAAAGEGCQGSVQFMTPASSIRSFDIDVDDGNASKRDAPSLGGLDFGLEFMSIPLITIVAKFVLQLFMPIVMFIMGLFWMLRLSFSIPSSLMAHIVAAAGPKARASGIDLDDDALGCDHTPADLTADVEYGP